MQVDKPLFRFNVNIGASNTLKFISAVIIALHHYAQYIVTQGAIKIGGGGRYFGRL